MVVCEDNYGKVHETVVHTFIVLPDLLYCFFILSRDHFM